MSQAVSLAAIGNSPCNPANRMGRAIEAATIASAIRRSWRLFISTRMDIQK